MAGKRLIIELTKDQQKQIKNETGMNVTQLSINLESAGGLSDEELDKVAGGISIKFTDIIVS